MNKSANLMISSGITLISVGILNIFADVSEKIKDFLTLDKAIGPYSGKLVFAVVIGILAWLIIKYSYNNKEINLDKAFRFLIIALLIATLFVFTPFIQLLVW